MMKLPLCLAAAALAGCATTDTTSAEPAALAVAINRAPAGITCIDFTFANEDGTVTDYKRALNAATLVLADVPAGAYDLTARAYSGAVPPPLTDADCAVVPGQAPWVTEASQVVILAPGERASATLRLVEAGSAGIHPVFVETPRVIAEAQGPVGQIAVAGERVAWVVHPSGAAGEVRSLAGTVASGQTNLQEIVIDPFTGAVGWTNYASGARDADGHLIPDGSVWQAVGDAAEQLATDLLPSDLQYGDTGTLYWGDYTHASIACAPCTDFFAFDQLSPNVLTAHGDRVYWSGSAGDLLARRTTEAAPTLLRTIAPRTAYGMSADDDNLYYIDFDATGSGASTIWSLPLAGGAPVALVAEIDPAFPIVAYGTYLYYADASHIARVPVAGGPVEPLVDGVIGGFAISTDADGHTSLVWTDATHGGLVWRGRVD